MNASDLLVLTAGTLTCNEWIVIHNEAREVVMPEQRKRRRAMNFGWILVAAGALLAVVSPGHAQPAFPDRPVRIIVGYAAGGPIDLVARAISSKLAEIWKQNVIVENRPGANSIVGNQAVAKADPDGYMLLLDGITHSINPSLYTNLAFDPLNDFTAIGQVGYAPTILVINDAVPAKTLAEFIAYAKARPGQLNFGSSGNGANTHLGVEMLKRAAKIDMVHVPYKGGAPAIADLAGGQVQVAMTSPPGARPFLATGKIRVIAITGKDRLKEFPGVPTLEEAGYEGIDVGTWYGVFGPPKLPAALVNKINGDLMTAVADADVQKRMVNIGAEVRGSTPEAFDRIVRADAARFGAIVKELNIKPEQ